MLRDADTIKNGSVLNADVCIIGGGPAGITVAHALAAHSARVVWLESAGIEAEESAQRLNEGTFVGARYAGLRQTRHRQLGGTACVWNTPLNGDMGAKYVPLDSCDFEARSAPHYPGWPFDLAHLQTYYERAQSFCGLGPFAYADRHWCSSYTTFSLPDARVHRSVYQFGPSKIFTDNHLRFIRSSESTHLLLHATACALTMKDVRPPSTIVEVGTLAGKRLRIQSKFVVLAAGAIENARLLMVSREAGRDSPGNASGWLGRCFMEHPRDYSMSLVGTKPEVYALARFYDRHRARDGTIIAGRIGLDAATVRNRGLPNASLTVLPLLHRPLARIAPVERFVEKIRRRTGRSIPAGYGWSELPAPERTFIGLRFVINVEQWPHAGNRVLLGPRKDRFGVPRPKVCWRWRDSDQLGLEKAKAVFGDALQAAGVGRLEVRRDVKPDPNAHHHAGTTRMHADSRLGVVDPDSLVHGTDNLYVVGASTFPTAGFANPTLTIVAMAIRLAEHLKQRL